MGKKKSTPKKFDTQTQLARLQWLVQRIQRGDYPSQKILAAEWQKNPRTIQRDLDYLRDFLQLPLAYDSKRYGYYFTEPVTKFPMVSISEAELVSVFVAQKALRQYHGTPFETPLRSAFEKLVSGLEGDISVAWADLDSAISFRGLEVNVEDAETFQTLSAAIRRRREIEFDYRKVWSDSTEASQTRGGSSAAPQRTGALHAPNERRRVRPYHLACINNQWYLFGYDLGRGAIRKFVPARMAHLRVRETSFARPRDFSVDKLLEGSFGLFSGSKPVEMKIWFDSSVAQIVKERKWHRSQRIRELKNGDIELCLDLSGLVEIVPWILGWGGKARALSPPGLVAAVREAVKELSHIYRP
jgi:proteasome accessory factor B